MNLDQYIDFDTWAYHWPQVLWMLSHHTFAPIPRSGLVGAYPYTWEFLGGTLYYWTRSTWLMSLPNLIALAALVAGQCSLSRKLGAPDLANGMCCSLTVIYWGWLVPGLRVDLALAAALVWAILAAMEGKSARMLLLIAIACALKHTGWIYGTIVALVFGIERLPSWRQWLVILAVALFWPIRNMIYYGHPLGGRLPDGLTATSLQHVGIDWDQLVEFAIVKLGLLWIPIGLGWIGSRSNWRLWVVAAAMILVYTFLPSGGAVEPYGAWQPWVFKTNLRFALPAWVILTALGAAIKWPLIKPSWQPRSESCAPAPSAPASR